MSLTPERNVLRDTQSCLISNLEQEVTDLRAQLAAAQAELAASRQREANLRAGLDSVHKMAARQMAEPVGENGDTGTLVSICSVIEALAPAQGTKRKAGRMLSSRQVEEMLARAEKATEEPWVRGQQSGEEVIIAPRQKKAKRILFRIPWNGDSVRQGANASLVMNARTDVPALAESLKEAMGLLRAVVQHFADCEVSISGEHCNCGLAERIAKLADWDAESEGEMSEWIPIESAPKDGTRLILFGVFGVSAGYWDANFNGELAYNADADDYESIGAWTNGEVESWRDELEQQLREPTHWMPLPAPPTTMDRACAEQKQRKENQNEQA